VKCLYMIKCSTHFEVKDSLFSELLSEEPGICRCIPYWDGCNICDPERYRQYALKFGHRYCLQEELEETAKYHLAPAYRHLSPEQSQKHGIKLMVDVSHRVVQEMHKFPPSATATWWDRTDKLVWNLDPKVLERSLQCTQEVLEKYGDKVWAIFAGDELISDGASVPMREFDFAREADREVKAKFGFGKWGIPESVWDENPFRWIAYRRWITKKFNEHMRRISELIKESGREIIFFGTDFEAHSPGDDVWEMCQYCDIVLVQTVGAKGERAGWKAPASEKVKTGYNAKLFSDLSGKPTFCTMHLEDYDVNPEDYGVYPEEYDVYPERYGGSSTPEDVREMISQVFRNGGAGILPVCVEFFDPELGHHKWASPRRWKALLELFQRIVTMNKVRVPTDPDAAIFYSYDTIGSRSRYRDYTPTLVNYTLLGPMCGSWFRFVADADAERGIDLSQYRAVFVPQAKYERESAVARLEEYVRQGGVLFVADPESFTYDIDGTEMAETRRRLLGADTMGAAKEEPTIEPTSARDESFPLRNINTITMKAPAYRLTNVAPEASVVAQFRDGAPAVIIHRLEKGKVIYFAANPFIHEYNAGSEEWISLLSHFLEGLGVRLGRNIWRFKFEPYRTRLEPPEPEGLCLTNNYVVFRDNEAMGRLIFEGGKNVEMGGTYSYTHPPTDIREAEGATEDIPFERGKLTNRKAAARNRPRGRARVPRFLLEDWVVRWKDSEPTSVIFDLKQPYPLKAVKLFYSGQLPEVTIQGSNDQAQWTLLSGSRRRASTDDVLDKEWSVTGDYRYVRLDFGPRDARSTMTLSEVEIWRQPVIHLSKIRV